MELSNEANVGEDGELLLTKTYRVGGRLTRATFAYNQFDQRHEKGISIEASALKTLYMMYKYVHDNNSVTVIFGGTILHNPASKTMLRTIARGRLRKCPQIVEVSLEDWVKSRYSVLHRAARLFGVKGARIDKGLVGLECSVCEAIVSGGWDEAAGRWLPPVGCNCER